MGTRHMRSVVQRTLSRCLNTTSATERSSQAAIANQVKQASKPGRTFATQADNSASAAGAAPKLQGQSMMGPYATWGLAGAGAGLLFLLYGSSKDSVVSVPGTSSGGQETREEASEARKAAGVHPVPICEFEMETHQGDKFTQDDLKGSFSILMFGDSVSNHALQGLAKMQEIVVEQDRQTNMHMNQPVWIVEDRELKNSEKGLKKLEEVVADHSKAKSSSRLTIVHGEDFEKIKKSVSDFAKTADKPAAEKVNAEEGVYYLVNPEGEFERAFGHDVDSLAIALAIASEVKKYKNRNPSWHGPKAVKKRAG